MSAVIVLQQMLVLFSMIAIGVFLWKKNWIDVKGQKALSKMVVNIFNPLLRIFYVVVFDGICSGIFIAFKKATEEFLSDDDAVF